MSLPMQLRLHRRDELIAAPHETQFKPEYVALRVLALTRTGANGATQSRGDALSGFDQRERHCGPGRPRAWATW